MSPLANWNLLCWNVRGLNSDDKQLALSNAIRSSGCSVVCLQETKKNLILIILILENVVQDGSTNLNLSLQWVLQVVS